MSDSESRQLKKTIGVRVTEEEHAEISAVAADLDVSVSAYARALVLGEQPVRRRRPKANIPRKELREVLGQLGKIGSNLNQLAHRANAEKKHACTQALKAELEALAAIREQVIDLLGGGAQ